VWRAVFTRFRPRSLDVVLAFDPEELRGDAALNFAMLRACGLPFSGRFRGDGLRVGGGRRAAGTGLEGGARGRRWR